MIRFRFGGLQFTALALILLVTAGSALGRFLGMAERR